MDIEIERSDRAADSFATKNSQLIDVSRRFLCWRRFADFNTI